jgi:hypothetical protein
MPRADQTAVSSSAKKTKRDKSSKKRAAEEGDDLGEVPDVDDQAAELAAARAQKKQKKRAAEDVEAAEEPEVGEEDEEASQAGEEEAAEEDPAAARLKLRRRREHKKVTGYRSKAMECGFLRGSGVGAAAGTDALMSALTSADAKRLMRFVPEVLGKSSYDKAECAARMKLSQEKVPASAARETQARCEAVMRKMMKEAVLRTAERGAMRVDAATMMSVLRPFHAHMNFTSFLPPKGLVRHAQAAGVLSATAADEEAEETEKAENKELSQAQKKIDAEELKRKEAFKTRKAELKAKREADAAAALAVN